MNSRIHRSRSERHRHLRMKRIGWNILRRQGTEYLWVEFNCADIMFLFRISDALLRFCMEFENRWRKHVVSNIFRNERLGAKGTIVVCPSVAIKAQIQRGLSAALHCNSSISTEVLTINELSKTDIRQILVRLSSQKQQKEVQHECR